MADIGRIGVGTGLVSGIDYSKIISALLEIEQRPITRLQDDNKILNDKKAGFFDLTASLLGLQNSSGVLKLSSFFNTTLAQSSNENVLIAKGNNISAIGTYSFIVKKLAQAHQAISQGFQDKDVTVGSGNLTIEIGNGFITKETRLDFLNGSRGVGRGKIQITNKAGGVFEVDLSGAVTVEDVIEKINSTPGIRVEAAIQGDRLILTDKTGGGGNLIVDNIGNYTTATDLGIKGSTSSSILYGSTINYLTNDTRISLLNDGNGIRFKAGSDFRITTKSGSTIDVDIDGNDVTVGDIIDAINNAPGNAGQVVASLNPDQNGIVLKDTTTGAGVISISPLNSSNAIIDLGLYNVTPENSATGQQDTSGGDVIYGRRLIPEIGSLLRRTLNGGVRLYNQDGSVNTDTSGISNGNLRITDRAGNFVNVSLVSSPNVETLSVDATAGSNTLTLSSTANISIGSRIRLTDGVNTEIFTVNDINGNVVTLSGVLTNNYASGSSVFNENILTAAAAAGATSITVASTAGLAVGTKIRITNGAATEYKTITGISGNTITFDKPIQTAGGFAIGSVVYQDKDSVSSIINTVNYFTQKNSVNVSIKVNNYGNGLLVEDSSGGTGNLKVEDVGTGSTGSDLGILINSPQNSFEGSDLNPEYISENTLLSSLNQGRGVYHGKFIVTDRSGKSFTVDITDEAVKTIAQVIDNINGQASLAGSSLRARINDKGNGIILIDSGAGVGKVKVVESGGGTTAKDLNILGTALDATPDRIDGSFEYVIGVTSTDTLATLVTKINEKNLPISVSIINDGSQNNPYRLSIISKGSGEIYKLIVRATSGLNLNFTTITEGQNAVVIYGSTPENSLLIERTDNLLNDLVPGMSISLVGVSDTPVTVSVTRDNDKIVEQVQKFVDSFNKVIDKINDLTRFDPNNPDSNKGVLLGEYTLRIIKERLTKEILSPVKGIPTNKINTLSKVGVGIYSGKLTFDSSVLRSALDEKFDEVKELFTSKRKMDIFTPLADLNDGRGVGYVYGDDLKFTRKDGVSFSIDINRNIRSVGDLLNLINHAPGNTGGLLEASISADGFSIEINDKTGGSGSLKVEALNNSPAGADLGIIKTIQHPGTTLTGQKLDILGDPGKGHVISELISDVFLDDENGLITVKTNSLDDAIKKNNQRITELESRLEDRRAQLVRTFAQLESILAQNQATQNVLSNVLSNINSFLTKSYSRR